jgi:hypothetical protein
MSNSISAFASIVRSLVFLAVLGFLGAGGWIAYEAYDHRNQLERDLKDATEQLAEKKAEIERLSRENQKLSLAIRLLKIDHRVAEITVLDQHDENDRPQTRFQFAELTKDGSPTGNKKEFTVAGDIVYVDAWVIKYADDLVEASDPLRSTSVCLFRRIFGEHQQPSEGFALDPAGSRPSVYSQGDEMSPIEQQLWSNFWEYANNPAKAKQAGVRAAHGEAPSIRLQVGKRYKVELRASGGLSIVPEDGTARPAS